MFENPTHVNYFANFYPVSVSLIQLYICMMKNLTRNYILKMFIFIYLLFFFILLYVHLIFFITVLRIGKMRIENTSCRKIRIHIKDLMVNFYSLILTFSITCNQIGLLSTSA